MSGYDVGLCYVQPPRYHYVPGKNPRECGWQPGLIMPKQKEKSTPIKDTLATAGGLTIAALALLALRKPQLLKETFKPLKTEISVFLAKHPNLKNICKGLKNIYEDCCAKVQKFFAQSPQNPATATATPPNL